MDIVAVSAGEYHTVGVRSDGTVVSTAIDNLAGIGDELDWSHVVLPFIPDWSDIKLP